MQTPGYPDSYYRYTYVLNNPLKFTDPTGYYLSSGDLKQEEELMNQNGGGATGMHYWNYVNGGGAGTGNFNPFYWEQKNSKYAIDASNGKYRDPQTQKTSVIEEDPITGRYYYEVLVGSTRTYDDNYNPIIQYHYKRVYLKGDPSSKTRDNIYGLPGFARLGIAMSGKSPISLPDAVGLTPLNVDMVALGGLEFSLNTKIRIVNGPNRGQIVSVPLDISGVTVGWDQGVSAIRTEYYFLGNYAGFSASDFFGERINLSVGFSIGVEVGIGVTYMNVDGGIMIGISRYIGISSPGVSGNINWGHSYEQ